MFIAPPFKNRFLEGHLFSLPPWISLIFLCSKPLFRSDFSVVCVAAVDPSSCNPAPVPLSCTAGDAGQAERLWAGVCSQGAEEGHYPAGRWCGVHYDWEEGPVNGGEPPLPHPALLLLPDTGKRQLACIPTWEVHIEILKILLKGYSSSTGTKKVLWGHTFNAFTPGFFEGVKDWR